jgi:hypothetical protein
MIRDLFENTDNRAAFGQFFDAPRAPAPLQKEWRIMAGIYKGKRTGGRVIVSVKERCIVKGSHDEFVF